MKRIIALMLCVLICMPGVTPLSSAYAQTTPSEAASEPQLTKEPEESKTQPVETVKETPKQETATAEPAKAEATNEATAKPQAEATQMIQGEEDEIEQSLTLTDDATEPEETTTAVPADEEQLLGEEGLSVASPSEAEVTPAPTAAAETEEIVGDVSSADAWMKMGEQRIYGKLDELIRMQADARIYIVTEDVIALHEFELAELKKIKMSPDRDKFTDEDMAVFLSNRSPQGISVEDTYYVWVDKKEDVKSDKEKLSDIKIAQDEDVSEAEIIVDAQGYLPGKPCTPTFVLSCIGVSDEEQVFAVSVEGADFSALASSTYTPSNSGEYRFAVLDANGNILARSAKYAVIIADATDIEQSEPMTEEKNEDIDVATLGEATAEDIDVATLGEATAEDIDAATLGEATTEDIGTATLGEAEMVTEALLPTILTLGSLELAASAQNVEITVVARDYYAGTLSDIAPVFTLSGLPDTGTYSYGLSVDGGAAQMLASNVYTATREGAYTLAFVIMNGDGSIAARSSEYSLNLSFSTESAINKQAWRYAEDGTRVYGTLASLLAQGGGDSKITIQSKETIVLYSGISSLKGISLVPDSSIFSDGAYQVIVSTQNPASASSVQGELYIYVTLKSSGGGAVSADITVNPVNYVAGQWSNIAPDFELSAQTTATFSYAVLTNGSTPILLGSSVYSASEEGSYTLTFALVDSDNQIIASSDSYDLMIDLSAPIMVTTANENTLTIHAVDEMSGIVGVSLDGGTTYTPVTSDENGAISCQYVAKSDMTFTVGMICIIDAAGNVSSNTQDVTLTVESGFGDMDGGLDMDGDGLGKSGGSGSSSRTSSHATSTTTSIIAYNAVELIVESTQMDELVLGGETLDLTCLKQSLNMLETIPFTASLARWNGDIALGADTLILQASKDSMEIDAQTGAYVWRFSGMVYKKLAASGIDYLVLRIDDDCIAVSTAGFTGGLHYNLLKTAGVASKSFEYSLSVGADDSGSLSLDVSVAGDEYALSNDTDSDFYYYNVYSGTIDMLNAAFGVSAAQKG